MDKLLKKANVSLVVGTSSWREQFIEAITVSAGMSSKSSLHPYSKNNQMPLSWYAVIIQNPEWQIKLLVVAGVVLQPLFGLEKLHIDPLYHFVHLSDNCCLLVCKQKAHQDNILFTPTHLPRTAHKGTNFNHECLVLTCRSELIDRVFALHLPADKDSGNVLCSTWFVCQCVL